MIVNMSTNATPDEINHIIERIKECGFQAHVVQGAERTIIGAIGSSGRRSEIEALRAAPGVEEVIQISHPFKLVSRQLRQARTLLGRIRRTTDGDCARRESVRCVHAAWRCL
jgi:3-deoxy-7-phosphoheptulonate synthase